MKKSSNLKDFGSTCQLYCYCWLRFLFHHIPELKSKGSSTLNTGSLNCIVIMTQKKKKRKKERKKEKEKEKRKEKRKKKRQDKTRQDKATIRETDIITLLVKRQLTQS
jgi:flagellar biosynthesis component FlhA